MKKQLYYSWLDIKHNKGFVSFVFFTVIFCTVFLAYSLTNFSNTRSLENAFEKSGLSDTHSYLTHSFNTDYEEEEFNELHFSELERLGMLDSVGFVDHGFSNLNGEDYNKCIRINPAMTKMFHMPLSEGRWLTGDVSSEKYEAVAAYSLKSIYKIGDVVTLNFSDYFYGKNKPSTITVEIVGFLEKESYGLGISNAFENLLTAKFDGLYIALDNAFWEENRAKVSYFYFNSEELPKITQSEFLSSDDAIRNCGDFLFQYKENNRQLYALSMILLFIMLALSFSGFSGMLLLRHRKSLYESCVRFVSGVSWKRLVLYNFVTNCIIVVVPILISFFTALMIFLDTQEREVMDIINLKNLAIALVLNLFLFFLSTLYTTYKAARANIIEICKEGRTWL